MKEDVKDCGGGKRIIRFIGNPKEWMAEFDQSCEKYANHKLKDGHICGDNILTFYRSKLINRVNRLSAKAKKKAFKALSFVGFLPPSGVKEVLCSHKPKDRYGAPVVKYFWHENEYDCGYFSYRGDRLDIKTMIWWEIYHHDVVAGKWSRMPFWVKCAVNRFHRINSGL